ncbi:hypothetical protein [Halomonas sp. M4R1S46]|uniref:hypothetical protein n=1 Tax=Halomonas sp. M4R1S46 TaxID=2982692 RepID=UPI0021E4411A|nr:hypothetical protein [Halomonas sp. M4R1S46]UYG09301.1 hypothetical protein OCT48_08225 [Halomonas sp. M4R1S46]
MTTQQVIRRGSFKAVWELVKKMDAFIMQDNYRNDKVAPFTWTATADSILTKL